MATRRQQRRINALVVLFGLSFGGLMVFSLGLIALTEGVLLPKVTLYADFRDVSSLGRHSDVQLDGKKIGRITDVEFITARYPCDPRTEDWGRAEARDDCEPWMFCVEAEVGGDPAKGYCAEFEEFSGRTSDYKDCPDQGSCQPGHMCMTEAFRRRYRDVRWWGETDWCVAYDVDSRRIRVAMEIDSDALQYIRSDSRVNAVLNAPLSNTRLNISASGSGHALEDGDRIQTQLSFMEEVLGLKDEIDRLAAEVERGLLGLSGLTDALTDDAAKGDLEAVSKHVAVIKRQLEGAQGLIGAVLNDPGTRADMSKTLREVKRAARSAQEDYAGLERRLRRTMGKTEVAVEDIEALLDALDDPANHSLAALLFNEDHGMMAQAASVGASSEEAMGAGRELMADMDAVLEEVMTAIEGREGTLGMLFYDPKPLYHLKDPATLRRVDAVKSFVRWVGAFDEAQTEAEADADTNAPPRPSRR